MTAMYECWHLSCNSFISQEEFSCFFRYLSILILVVFVFFSSVFFTGESLKAAVLHCNHVKFTAGQSFYFMLNATLYSTSKALNEQGKSHCNFKLCCAAFTNMSKILICFITLTFCCSRVKCFFRLVCCDYLF